MRNSHIKKRFEVSSSHVNKELKHSETASTSSHSECHRKLSSRKTVGKTHSFRQRIFGTNFEGNSPKHGHYRIFKSFRKKNKSKIEQSTGKVINDRGQNFQKKSISGKVQKTKYKTTHQKDKLNSLDSRQRNGHKTLKKAFSLRLKSRTDSQSEKIDISSLVKIVNFQTTGKRLASNYLSKDIIGKPVRTKVDIHRMKVLKQSNSELNVPSPTCGDEEGFTVFNFESKHLLMNKFSESHILDRKILLDASENDNPVSLVGATGTARINSTRCLTAEAKEKNAGKLNAVEKEIKNERNNGVDEQSEYETYANLKFHVSESVSKQTKTNSVEGSAYQSAVQKQTGNTVVRINKSESNTIEDTQSFRKESTSKSCDIIVENFGNPWVLQSDFDGSKETTNSNKTVSNDAGSPVSYESLGFSVNLDAEKSLLSPNAVRRAKRRVLKRSTSIESVDSFNSSIHSVKSEECLFSSDSEDNQVDSLSISSSDSFASAKDYPILSDLRIEFAEKIKQASSLEHLDKISLECEEKVQPSETLENLDATPTIKTPVKHTFSADDVHRIIQRPKSLSFSKSLDSASKTSKTPKSEKKKEKNKRRSLDSAFKTAEIQADFKAEFEKQTLKSASSDSGLSSAVLSPVQENGDVKIRGYSTTDSPVDKIYYTLPNPRKTKSYPPPPLPLKKKANRIGSLSKMISETAESISGLRIGSSFKLRNLEKPITSGLNKTKSLTNLMSKKGIRVVSSISSMIKGKSTSDTNVDEIDSPFKPKKKTPSRNKEKDNEFVYEKVKVLVPRKRPANKQELAAERRRLTLDLKLANIKQNDSGLQKALVEENEVVKRRKKGNSPSSPETAASVSMGKSPIMLDEIMKSVDTRRFSTGLALAIENISDNEADDTSSRSSSTGLVLKKRSMVSDITTPGSVFLNGEDYFSVCPRCKKMKDSPEAVEEIGDLPLEKRTHSLLDVNSCCTCCAVRKSCDNLSFVDKNKLNSHGINVVSEISFSTPCHKRLTYRSLQELSHVNEIPFQNYVDARNDVQDNNSTMQSFTEIEGGKKLKLTARRSLPYTMTKCQPCLDSSADDLDEICSDDDTDQNLYQKTQEKSHSCSDLLDNTIENDPVIYTEVSGRPVERIPSKRSERPPVKVKSLSSSHDALACLSSVDIPDIDRPLENSTVICEKGVTRVENEFMLLDSAVKQDIGESSDSGNEDYHSVGSEYENHEFYNDRKDSEVSDHTGTALENSLDSGLTLPDSQILLNSFENIKIDNGNTKAYNNRVLNTDSENTLNESQVSKTDISKPVIGTNRAKNQTECSQCLLLNTANEQKSNYPSQSRHCFSVEDIRVTCCVDNLNQLATLNERAASVTEVDDLDGKCPHCGVIKDCVSKINSDLQKLKPSDNDGLKVKNKDTSFDSKTNRFLFDDRIVKSYKNIIHGTPRLKSVSSDDIHCQPKLDSVMPTKSPSTFSIHKQGYGNSPNNIHDKLYFDSDFFAPNLSPLNGIFTLPPFQGFSAFSPPVDGSQLPELEEVYKYDICLGYLMHSITCDNKTICVYSLQRNKQLMEGVITPISGLPGTPHTRPSESSHGKKHKSVKKPAEEDMPNPAAPITTVPSEKLSHAGHVLRTILLSRASHMIRDRKFHLRTYRRCMVGTEMVDWLLQQSSLVHSRTQAVGMWQALVEEGVIVHVCHEHQFKDKYLFYRFLEDDQGISSVPSAASKKECEDELQEVFLMLAQIGPDAMMRMILRKLPHERTVEDLEIIYEELLHIKALSHLSTMVKRELASVLVFESHAKAGTVLFNQGDEGKSWYIILKGSVNVVIYGKGVVCTLHEGDDFGKLALVNDAPRAATIVLRDDNCHFLRVDKDDFNRILRDVEANTVRLKEHGQDVLVLEKIPTNTQSADGTVQAHYKYSIMAGTPEKMLEHLLETMLGNKGEEELGMFRDGFLEDFLLTHVIFMPCNHLCPVLLSHYHSSMSDSTEQENFEYMLNHKKGVLHFVQEWARIVGGAFREDHTINAFLEELHSCVLEDQQAYFSLRDDLELLENVLEAQTRLQGNQLLNNSGQHPPLTRKASKDNLYSGVQRRNKVIKASDENIFKVYCADHTYCTLRLPMDTSVEQILSSARDKLCLGEDLILCEVKSTGERIAFKENDLCVTSGLSINGRLFITPREHLDALTPLPEQEGPQQSSMTTIELVSSREMAYHMTLYDWDLFSCVQEYELIYQVFGRYKFRKITANLDLFLRRFNEIQYWVVTEMVLTTNLSKRVALLRKFIKLASYCKDYQNLNSFFAIVMGLSNIAVSRLSQTWEKLPGKFKKMFADFETLMDPSRNHRVYRLSVAKMVPPIIPFMPLLMKDMTFTHEGNKTYFDGLVNFEKMHMIAQTLKTVRFCRSSNLELEVPSSLKSTDVSNFIRNLHVIDNQRHLTQLSQKLEPRKT